METFRRTQPPHASLPHTPLLHGKTIHLLQRPVLLHVSRRQVPNLRPNITQSQSFQQTGNATHLLVQVLEQHLSPAVQTRLHVLWRVLLGLLLPFQNQNIERVKTCVRVISTYVCLGTWSAFISPLWIPWCDLICASFARNSGIFFASKGNI